MKMRWLNWLWIVVTIVFVNVLARADDPAEGMSPAQKSLKKTRRELQAQGFKTDLTNFDFSTSPESRGREDILKGTAPNRKVGTFIDHPDQMEVADSNSVILVWQQDSLRRQTPAWPDGSYALPWEDFRAVLSDDQPQIDAACLAILAGPIQFNLKASGGNMMLLPHLALLKNLTQRLNDGSLLDLHDGNKAAAWTNLLAATRLVTAWNPEPAMVSHEVRFELARLVFGGTWQVLQSHGWTDDQLARLQHEWESADFLGHLPEIQEFQCASDVQMLERDEADPQKPDAGEWAEEERLLLFYRDREMDYRDAVQAGSWKQMRLLPGVTNEIFFEPKNQHRGRFAMQLLQRRMRSQMMERAPSFLGRGTSLLARAAEAETERRIMITALALERYDGKYQRYPSSLPALAPEFLPSVPVDFMNGEPLHYQVSAEGHFLLYSVGLDGVDNGGTLPKAPTPEERFSRMANRDVPVPESDLVWPLAASAAQVTAFRQAQAQAAAEFKAQRAVQEQVEEQSAAQQAVEARQEAMKRLLAEKPSLGKEPVYQGKPLSSWVDKVGEIERYNGAPPDAVAAIRAIGPAAVPFLLEWMPHPGAEQPVEGFPEWDSVCFAWWALGEEGQSAIPTLARIISQPRRTMEDYSVWTENAKAISYLGPDAIVPMLMVATNMAGQHELWELLHNFENLGTNGAAAVPALMHWATNSDSWVRDGVVSALGGIGARPDLAVPAIVNALHDPDWMVRRDAGEALGNFARDSATVLPELIKIVKNPVDSQARDGALSGLGKIRDHPEVVVPLIVPYLNDANSVVARSAAYALRDLGNDAGYQALLQATNNPNIRDIVYEVQEKVTGTNAK